MESQKFYLSNGMKSSKQIMKLLFILIVLTYFSINAYTQTSGLWKGLTNDWSNASNWDDNIVPSNTVDVVIPTHPSGGDNYPVVGATVSCRNLTIYPLANVTINIGKTLNVAGDLLVKSGTNGSGAILDIGTLNITGNATTERYITGASGYHYISNPVHNTDLNQINDDVALLNLGFGYFDPSNPPYAYQMPNMWKLDETHSTPDPAASEAWLAPSNLSEIMTDALGYALVVNSGTVVDITGSGANLNTGDISINLSKTDLGGGAYGTGGNGWHLIGNPYMSPIDWDVVAPDLPAGVSHTLTLFCPTSMYYGGFGYYHPIAGPSGAFPHNQYVPSMQSFYINTASNTTVTFNNTHRTVTADAMSTALYKSNKADKNTKPIIRLSGNILPENGMNDVAIVYFDTNATTDFNGKTDAYKLMNTETKIPNVYSRKGNENLSINALPEILDNLTVPIGYDVSLSGSYAINATEIKNFDSNVHIFLDDMLNNVSQDLTINPLYTFTKNPTDNGDRFYLRFAVATGINNIETSGLYNAFTDGKTLHINYLNMNKENAVLNVYNIQGQSIISDKSITSGKYQFEFNQPAGFYIVKFISNNNVYNQKIYLQ